MNPIRHKEVQNHVESAYASHADVKYSTKRPSSTFHETGDWATEPSAAEELDAKGSRTDL